MKGMIKKVPGEASWITYIKKRIRNNLNFLAITTGGPGKGKTYSDLSIAYQIDPEFDCRYQVAFSFYGFMQSINRFNGKDLKYLDKIEDENFTPLHKRKYKVIIFEETQTTVNKRNWQSQLNKMFLYLMSTFRHQNFIILMNMPYQDYVDSSTMKLIHAKFEAVGHNKKKQRSYVRPLLLQYNDKQSKFYTHNLKVIRNNRLVPLAGLWGLPKAPEHILESYEEMKTAFTDKLNEKITRDAKLLEEGEDPDKIDNRKPLTEKQEQVLRTLAGIKEGNRYEIAAQRLGLGLSGVGNHVILARKKGWDIKDFEEDSDD